MPDPEEDHPPAIDPNSSRSNRQNQTNFRSVPAHDDKAVDFILLDAVWMPVPPANRRRAFRKLVMLLKPRGWMEISFRPPDPGNSWSMFPCHVDEFEQLARVLGKLTIRIVRVRYV